jgi:hypothetical protein
MFSAELSLGLVLVIPGFEVAQRMDTCRTSSFSASVFAIVSTFGSLLTAGCGGEETYSEKHSDIVAYDCAQTAPCDPVFSIKMDSIGECVSDTSQKLDRGSEAMQAMYETRFSRCQQYMGCDYFNCAQDTMLFSIVNEQKLQYDCMQQTVCKISQGMPTVPTENGMCFSALAQQLDFSSVPDRASWDQRFARCGTMQGCAYTSCK